VQAPYTPWNAENLRILLRVVEQPEHAGVAAAVMVTIPFPSTFTLEDLLPVVLRKIGCRR